MDDCASLEDSSMTIVQAADSTIAFAYIKEIQSKKKRFYVLKSQPRRSSIVSEYEPTKTTLNLPPKFFLYAYKNKKYYEKNEPKRVYDLANLILLSRSTKKANQTILGVCLQDEALYLEFDTEDELSRWYFHLNEIFSAHRNCLWPELKQCVNVTLKNKDLAAASSKHGKANLPGQYRFCLTDSAVLLVKDDLLDPVLSLPFPCIRTCIHSTVSNLLKIDLGRLSPIGEGFLHFKAEQSSPFKEMVEHLVRCLHETGSKDLEIVKSRKNRRNSRQSAGSEDYQAAHQQRPASVHCLNQRSSCIHCSSRSSVSGGSLSGGQMKPSQSNSGLGALASSSSDANSAGAGRGYSLPSTDVAPPNLTAQQQTEDYCLMEMSTDSNETGNATGFRSRSPNSSMSLSTAASEVTGCGDSGATGGSAASTADQRSLGSDERAARFARVSTWRHCDCQHPQNHYQQQQQQQANQHGGNGNGSPVIRANSIGCRPMTSRGGLFSHYPVHHHCQQQQQQQKSPHLQTGSRMQQQQQQQHRNSSSHQVFTEHSFSRPRTTSDAASLHACCQGYSSSSGSYASSSSRSFRPRARSYGNKFGRSALLDGEALGVCDISASSSGAGASPSPSLTLSTCMRPLSESIASSSDELQQPQQQQQPLPSRQPQDDEGSYVTMLLRPTRSCLRGGGGGGSGGDRTADLQFRDDDEAEDQFDPYWTPPCPLNSPPPPAPQAQPPPAPPSPAAAAAAAAAAAPPPAEGGKREVQEPQDADDYFMMDCGH